MHTSCYRLHAMNKVENNIHHGNNINDLGIYGHNNPLCENCLYFSTRECIGRSFLSSPTSFF